MAPLRSNWFGRKQDTPEEASTSEPLPDGNREDIDSPEQPDPAKSSLPGESEAHGGNNSPPPTGGGGDEPPPPAGNQGNHAMGLDALVQGLQHAAFSANQFMTHQYIAMLSQLFTQNPDGSYTADYAQLQLDDAHRIHVPLVALAPPRNLSVEKMAMRLTVRGNATEAVNNLVGQGERGHFNVTMAPHSESEGRDSRDIDIEIHFIAQEPPEAVMRLLDEFIHRMTPVPVQENRHE